MAFEIDAKDIHYRQVNEMLRAAIARGEEEIVLRNINGQRYLAAGVSAQVKIDIYGTPGLDLGAFMRGPVITVHGNTQDGAGNTMDEGKIIVRGMAGDVVGYAMRGGKIHVESDVGYRVGIHMKAYMDKVPVIIIGGKAGDFLGEYMAGGVIILLGINSRYQNRPLAGLFLGTGMHGGVIYVRGELPETQLGKGLGLETIDSEDEKLLREYLTEYCEDFGLDLEEVMAEKFFKIRPQTHRPYGKLYAY
jgi:glutamate synthase domain-containing protein 3